MRFRQGRSYSHSATSPLPSQPTVLLTETLQAIVSLPRAWSDFIVWVSGDTFKVPPWLLLSLSHLKHPRFSL